jgi:hypothetical protein
MGNVTIARDHPSTSNPIDIVEELVSANEWAFDRASDEEMVVEVVGRWAGYRMHFVWQRDLSAMYFSCLLDIKVAGQKRAAANELLALINEKMWLGHFEIASEDGGPMFRHTVLLRGHVGASVEQVEDLVDIAVAECERFYPAFQFVLWGGKTAADAVAASMLDTVGEA